MMLNMANTYQTVNSMSTSRGVGLPLGSSSSSSPSSMSGTAAMAALTNAAERESIHSGQFMVSHFEAEEAQDDLLDDDGEVKMLDPEDPSLSKPDEPNPCMEVQLYVPRKASLQQTGEGYSMECVTAQLEIETSLTKLFKCMNLAYSQKLTSPKWNHFKGVRLRWKDKIRLNNVIWRCWHMQFILKRKTPVCQFASPLDVDIHSNPQTVVLEGKYWKRQLAVIKAEYRKWRKNYKSKATGCLIYDTKSEFDFLECSPLNERNLMLCDDWASDTLFAAINGPFPFPDSREIARGAGIADFIQPSLGSLQPNLDDIDPTFAELLQSTRLPPVPEEGTEDMVKSVYYGFSAIMAPQMDASHHIMDVTAEQQQQQQHDDANMLELNTPLNTLQYSDIEQQFASRQTNNVNQLMSSQGTIATTTNTTQQSSATATSPSSAASAANHMTADDPMMADERTAILLHDRSGTSPPSNNSRQQTGGKLYGNSGDTMMGRQNCNDFPGKSVIKGRISKNFQRGFRREPHNYDKAQPTLHQTTIYQQMLAEQQKTQQQQQQQQQHHLQPTINANMLQHQATTFPQQQQQQQPQHHQTLHHQQQQLQYNTTQFPQSTGPTTSPMLRANSSYAAYNTNVNNSQLLSNMLDPVSSNVKTYGIIQQQQQGSPTSTANGSAVSTNAANNGASTMMLNVKVEPSSTDVLSMFNMSATAAVAAPTTSGNANEAAMYNSFKKSVSAGAYINMREGTNLQANVNHHQQQQHQAYSIQQQQQQQQDQSNSSQTLALGINTNTQQQQQFGQMQTVVTQLSPSAQQQQQQQMHINNHQQNLQQQQQQQQQLQQQLQQQNSQICIPKEMYRSNSLPLNATLQKSSNNENFIVPKYHMKSHTKSRSRSNSIHQHTGINHNNNTTTTSSSTHQAATNNNNNSNSTNCTNPMVTQQLHTATSDPMLNSTIAQLLRARTHMSPMAKQQSSSTSAISSMNTQLAINSCATPPTKSQSIPANSSLSSSTSGLYLSTTQPSTGSTNSSSLGIGSLGSTPPNAESCLQRHPPTSTVGTAGKSSPKKSTSLPAPLTPLSTHSPPASKTLSYPLTGGGNTSHLSLSPESYYDQDLSPLSPTHCPKFPRGDNQRRAGHIHAEQKRRYNIKNGFDSLHLLIPQLQQNPNAKLSKAAMLQKGADHIKQLRSERTVLKDKTEALQKEKDALNNSLTHLHSILPANGAPVTRQGTEHVHQLYEQYVRYRTMTNWKFWILGLILEPMLSSYTSSVSSASMEELRRTSFLWVDQHCSLVDLRPAVSNKLKYLSMKTDILSDPPSTLHEEVIKAVNTNGHPNLHGT